MFAGILLTDNQCVILNYFKIKLLFYISKKQIIRRFFF